MRFWLPILLLTLGVAAQGTTYNCVDCTSGVVISNLFKTVNGDTVVLPAGTASWSTLVVASNSITLQGAGTNSTIITSTLGPGLLVTNTTGGNFRLTGITFNGGASSTFGPVEVIGFNVRVDSCLFTNCALYCFLAQDCYGVCDHSVFKETDGGAVTRNDNYGGQANGDGSWTNNDLFGTTNFFYYEDDTFVGVAQNGAMDSYGGARWVLRHSLVTNDIAVAHGTDSTGRPRGTRAVEIYQNTFGNNVGSWGAIFETRSGVTVVWSNTTVGFATVENLRNYRSPACGVPGTYLPWGICQNGTNAWDGDTDNNGYPALDQCGRGGGTLVTGVTPGPIAWPNETNDVDYQWGNGTGLTGFNPCAGLFVEGRDYSNNVARPGYTPLVYPHPLVNAAVSFTLTVNSGSGSGTYTSNSVVNISANGVFGQAFQQWTGNTNSLGNPFMANTTATVTNNMTVTATYTNIPGGYGIFGRAGPF